MNVKDKVAVCSRSLSANKVLRTELLSRYQHVKFNDAGLSLTGDELKEFIFGSTEIILLKPINYLRKFTYECS